MGLSCIEGYHGRMAMELSYIDVACAGCGKSACTCRGGLEVDKSDKKEGVGTSETFAARSQVGGIWPFWLL